jgi:hypothetical protein
VAAQIVEALREIRKEGLRSCMREAPSGPDSFPNCCKGFLVATRLGELHAEIIEACREIGEEGVRSRLRHTPIDVDGLVACR